MKKKIIYYVLLIFAYSILFSYCVKHNAVGLAAIVGSLYTILWQRISKIGSDN